MIDKLKSVWQSPFFTLAAVVAGAVTGIIFPNWSSILKYPGEFYLALLQMTILPIVCTAIVASLGSALLDGQGPRMLIRTAIVFGLLLVMAALIGIGVGLAIEPGGTLSGEAQRALGNAMASADNIAGESKGGLWSFIVSMITPNIATSASEGNMLAVMSFSVLVGIALGSLEEGVGRTAINAADTLFQAMFKIMSWVLYFLPIGVFSLVAVQASQTGMDTLVGIGKLLSAFYVGLLLLMVALLVIVMVRRRLSPLTMLRYSKEPMLIGLATESDFAAIPSAVTSAKKLGGSQRTAELSIPIGANMANTAFVLYYAIAIIFALQLYGKPVTFDTGVMILIGSILITLAGADLPMLPMIMIPLGLPAEVLIVTLTAIGSVVNPLLVGVNVLGNIVASLLISSGDDVTPTDR